ncbi:unnamed protein product [Boreogadus saida]
MKCIMAAILINRTTCPALCRHSALSSASSSLIGGGRDKHLMITLASLCGQVWGELLSKYVAACLSVHRCSAGLITMDGPQSTLSFLLLLLSSHKCNGST